MQKAGVLLSAPPLSGQALWLSHIGFLLIGIVNTMLGPLLPLLSARWQLDDFQSGSLFLVQPAGAIFGSGVSGALLKRFGYFPLLALGFALMAISTACLGLGEWGLGAISLAGSGFALGLTIPTINLLIAELNAGRRAAALNLLNLVWGLGAVIGPLLLSALSRASSLTGALLALSVSTAAVSVWAARGEQHKLRRGAPVPNQRAPPTITRLWLSSYTLLTGALVFVNIGVEAATGGWIASYVQRLSLPFSFSWSLAPSLFWTGLLCGRAIAPFVLRRTSEAKMILGGACVAVGGLLIVLLSAWTTLILSGVLLAGLGLAPIFPNTIALFTERHGADAPRLTGGLFILAGLGAALFPWSVGFVSSHFQNLRAGLVIPLVGGGVLIGLQLAIMSVMGRDRRVAESGN